MFCTLVAGRLISPIDDSTFNLLGKNSELSLFEAMFHNNVAYMTAQINKLKRDLGNYRDTLRGYHERGVAQEWIDEKIEQLKT